MINTKGSQLLKALRPGEKEYINRIINYKKEGILSYKKEFKHKGRVIDFQEQVVAQSIILIQEEFDNYELNKLVCEINNRLWDNDRKGKPFYTEMLLFSIADNEIFSDITQRINITMD